MECVKLNEAYKKVNSPSCAVYEYPMQNREISIGVTELSGRYPEEGWALNRECVEMGYVIQGSGRLITETECVELGAGDTVLIPRGHRYYWEGTMSVVLPTTPPWHPEQHVIVKDLPESTGDLRKFRQNKLWRDKAVDLMEEMGSKIHWICLDDALFAEQLKIKLKEEAEEVSHVKTKESLKEELADILEVVASFCELNSIPMEEIVAIQRKKNEERGGFQGHKFVTVAEHPRGGFGEKYCLKDPEKYPEIVE